MRVIITGKIDDDLVKLNKETFKVNLEEVIKRITHPFDKYEINVNYSDIKIEKSSKIGRKYHSLTIDSSGVFKIELEADVSDKFIRIGKLLFKKCNSCPLTDEEIISLLTTNILKPIMGFFDVVDVEFDN